MALPLTVPTFYRMPDASPSGATIADMLNAVYSTLTSSVDYRGTTIPSTHLWTWATGSTSGSISAIYNTAIPSGSTMTQNPTIIIAGFSGSATPTMSNAFNGVESYDSSSLLIGLVKNGGAYNGWDSSSPMTTGSFTGYSRLGSSVYNSTSTIVRTYISQDLIFVRIIQDPITQYWAFAGAIIEPYTSYADSLSGIARSAETDDRIYGVNSSGVTSLNNNFTVSNTSLLYWRGVAFLPTTSTVMSVSRKNIMNVSNTTMDVDFAGNYICQRISFLKWQGSAVIGNAAVGTLNGIYYSGVSRYNTTVVRDNSTDLLHILHVNTTGLDADVLALKAAP